MIVQHALLKRQLKRLFGGMELIPAELRPLIEAVDQAYLEADADRRMLERSLELSSQELLQANSQMRAIVQAFPDIFFLLDSEGTILSSKGGTTTDFIVAPEQLIGKRIQDAPLGTASAKFEQAIRFVQERQITVSVEYERRQEKETVFYEARLVPLPDKRILMIVRNMSERKRAEIALRSAYDDLDQRIQERTSDLVRANQALREQIAERKRIEEERDRFFAVSMDMLCVAGFDGYFKQLNPSWEKTLGWTIEELLARPYLDFIHPEDRAPTIAEAQNQKEGRPALAFENRYQCKDGTYRWFQWNATPFVEQGLIYATARDITEGRNLEEQLRQSQKMDAIGRLAGGIAHDFNNLLTVIIGYSQLMEADLEPGMPHRETVGQIALAADRAASLTRQLLAFSRRQVLQPRELDLNAVVTKMQQLLNRMIGEDIKLVTSLAPQLGQVRADPSQIDQILINTAVNGREAMPQGGQLTIETANVEFDGSYTFRHMDAQEGHYVMLAVSDTGCGMPPEIRARVFEPFFTTKEAGKGTGLGLSTVYGIVKQSGGYITVYSEPGIGSAFKVYLPRVLEESVRSPVSPESKAVASGRETILLVEDEAAVRKWARLVLERRGYTVLEVSNYHEALQCSEQHDGQIHLLLTDVIMPDGSGRLVAERLTTERKDMRVLYMSGYTDNAIVHHGVLSAGTFFLQKPFTMDALARKVREVLDSPGKASG